MSLSTNPIWWSLYVYVLPICGAKSQFLAGRFMLINPTALQMWVLTTVCFANMFTTLKLPLEKLFSFLAMLFPRASCWLQVFKPAPGKRDGGLYGTILVNSC